MQMHTSVISNISRARLRPGAVALMAALCLALCSCGGSREPEYRKAEGMAWGTTYHITYKNARDLADTIAAEIARIDSTLSPFCPGSLISRVNAGDTTVRADRGLAEVMALSQRVCRISGGAFDPTVAPLVNLWGFGYAQGAADVPDSTAIDSALRSVGILDCSVTPDGRVIKKSPATEFNFSAVAKGYGVDRVAEALRRCGCEDYMVEIGGEIALRGRNSRGEDWHIQIDAPESGPDGEVVHNSMALLALTDCCIATSGNYRNYRSTSAGTVGHTISPATGRPVATSTLSATIIAPDCALADALATASMAMPADSARAMLEAEGVRAILAVAAPDGSLSIIKIGDI